MIRILISSSTFPIHLDDGLPRFVYDLAAAIAKKCEVTALVPDAYGASKRETVGGVDVHRFSYFYPRRWQSLAYGYGMRDNLRSSLLCRFQFFPFVLSQVHTIRTLVKAKKITLVNSHWMTPQGFSCALVHGSARRFRHVVSVHAADVYMLKSLPFGRALARFVMAHTDFVFADGSKVRDQLDDLLGWPSRAVVQPMGVHTDLFRNANLEPEVSPFPEGYLLFFGRFSEKKGVTYLLNAMPKVLKHHPGIGLISSIARRGIPLGVTEKD